MGMHGKKPFGHTKGSIAYKENNHRCTSSLVEPLVFLQQCHCASYNVTELNLFSVKQVLFRAFQMAHAQTSTSFVVNTAISSRTKLQKSSAAELRFCNFPSTIAHTFLAMIIMLITDCTSWVQWDLPLTQVRAGWESVGYEWTLISATSFVVRLLKFLNSLSFH